MTGRFSMLSPRTDGLRLELSPEMVEKACARLAGETQPLYEVPDSVLTGGIAACPLASESVLAGCGRALISMDFQPF
jgi:hypothetical protein